MKRDIQILMHTHWDREWYFTKDETKVLLRNHMQEVMEYLEENPDVIYVLDGQSVMIDDYLELEPEAEDRLRQLIQKGNLRVGPWYTQTDLLLVHGESIFRNLYYGIKRAREFGDPMLVGYAPDTFGHASQMPQIYDQFGIQSTFFWRGFSELKADKSDFVWKGADGTEILGVNLATGYQGAKYLELEQEALKERMGKIMNVLDSYSASDARLIMNGHDQMPIQTNIKEVIEEMQNLYPDSSIKISDFESYANSLNKKELEIVTGELTDSKHARIHRTIGSTRMDIKLLNSEIEYNLYNILEPLAVIGQEANIPYPYGVIEKILKLLFGTHAHDSIGGCNSDKVNQDIKQRLLNAKEMLDTQIELHLRLLTMANKENEQTLVVLNLLPEVSKEKQAEFEMVTRTRNFEIYDEKEEKVPYSIVSQSEEDAGLIDRQVAARLQDITVYRTQIVLPVSHMEGLSIKYYHYTEVKDEPTLPAASKTDSIENKWGKLSIQSNQFHYEEKGTEIMHQNILSIENSGDDGDSYDYSPPIEDWLLNSQKNGKIDCTVIKQDDMEEIQFDWTVVVPRNANARERKEANTTVTFNGSLRMYPQDPKVYLTLNHSNQVEDTRYRLVLKTGIKANVVEVDGYLSSQEKPVYLAEPLAIWEEDNWVEKPVSIETAQSYIAMRKENEEFALYTRGLKEYEVLEDEVHLTLFRTFSHLGKRNLVNRPGRPSGIEVDTPDNQLLDQTMTFQCAFGFEKKENNLSKEARNYLTPLVAYQRKEFNRFNLNARKGVTQAETFLSLDLKETVVSAVKLTEKNEMFIRLFNPEKNEIILELPEGTYLANAMEEKVEPITQLKLNSQEIANFILEKN
ncbi:hypothetical protein JTF06_10435 [Desemzia sp. RIT804]|uniref:glycoside hydrolase family 38 N-terminal domain-containing protein n=1 Tax=Desemzia sp. RIT 804 TaxID=2810209 RepID=UPI0019516D05|nr:glycoside hydrolase family 38 C-terminal domain-containing protein [Desemzia sp. RIT 804]MBM6615304.1 hypothetical protein [Desemzia sp. RIT 804]